ncbi:F-box only protein 32 [Aplysia californica]|uniref:F-box only protein 32 n=1 Tax=Aplysia californica TaxID=6500 RepID=A0ABM0JEW7_APLCA|nr:F-box only protein 32 [Aplysia californica]
MPFMGQDWRSPGDRWVRTTEGWEKMRLWRVKIFEGLNENVVARINRLAQEDFQQSKELTTKRQPFILYNNSSSKERVEFTSFSEAIVRLDMSGAVRDIKRANYMTKLLSQILETKLPSLSGTSQKHILNILESMVNEAIKTELNIGLMKDLLDCAHDALKEGKHYHIGSQCLWSKHNETVDRLKDKLAEYQLKERNKDGKLMLADLPTDCLRVIFSQIPDHKDVLRAGQTSMTLNQVTEESSLWRGMCLYHFSNRQIMTFLPKDLESVEVDWKYIYRRCYKRFGRKDAFADMLAICCQCDSIHWKSLGHPCISDQKCKVKELTPEDFMLLFKL